ncbi:MAG: SWIM zinc finger family protein [Polyangiaceae bacterium]
MNEVRNIPVGDLRLVVTDVAELAKGTRVVDSGGITHLARHDNKLFADAAGSDASPYKVQIVFGDGGKVTGRCTCMASRSRPYCKHAAALLVAWARAPEAFAMAEAPPQPPPGDRTARTAMVKKGKLDASALRKMGIDQAFTLLSELWQTGVATLAEDRAPQVRDLAASLRELGLRRLSARTLELAALLGLAARRDGSFSADAYAELFSDMWLTVRKLEKHLGGEPLADEHVEELIGRTWTKKDRKPIEGLDLVEYAFLQRITPDGFVLRESRFLDVGSGEHFTEKQILPAMMARRIPAKPSYRGRRLRGAGGSLFPSFAPRRLDLASPGELAELDDEGVRAVAERALPTMARALAALSERRRDPFAPPAVPVLVRVDGVIPSVGRVRLLDTEGGTLFLAGGRPEEDALMTALSGMRVMAVFGDATLEGALPSLLALAVIGERDGKPALVPLGGDDASARDEARAAGDSSWATVARRTAVSSAATLLAEARGPCPRLPGWSTPRPRRASWPRWWSARRAVDGQAGRGPGRHGPGARAHRRARRAGARAPGAGHCPVATGRRGAGRPRHAGARAADAQRGHPAAHRGADPGGCGGPRGERRAAPLGARLPRGLALPGRIAGDAAARHRSLLG